MPSDDPEAAFPHPNLPRRGPLALMFAAIAVSGLLGGTIGYGLVNTSCPSTATVAEHLLEVAPGFHAHTPSCDLKLLGGAVTGTALAAIGAGVVAMLMIRAQAEWRSHPAGRDLHPPGGARPGRGRSAGKAPPATRSQSGETPPRT